MANVCLKSGAARKGVVFMLLENFGANKRKTPPQISVVGFLVTPTESLFYGKLQ